MSRLVVSDVLRQQYGVQVVWADPVKAGAVREGEVYVPRWDWLDTLEMADAQANRYRTTLGEMAERIPTLWQTEGFDPDQIWMDKAVAEVNRAVRDAIEIYSEPKEVHTHVA